MPGRKPQPKLTPEQAAVSITGGLAVTPQPITHVSYSGRNKYQDCPKAYELTYVMGAPQVGSVWFVGGIAVHAMTEEWDRWTMQGQTRKAFDLQGTWKRVFNEALEREKLKDPDFMNWRKAGVKKDNPEGESLTYWYTHLGPKLAQSYMAWRRRSPWRIWRTPDGEPAIELDLGGPLPGMVDCEFKGFVDRVFLDPMVDELIVVDLKTGSRKPDSPLQFGVYRAGLLARYGVEANRGAAFMNRNGTLSDPYNLTMYTPEYIGEHFAQMHRAVQAGYFVPKVGRNCGMCDVANACYANSGLLAAQYDRDFPGNRPGF